MISKRISLIINGLNVQAMNFYRSYPKNIFEVAKK